MNAEKINAAVVAAQEFIRRAEIAEPCYVNDRGYPYSRPKQTGAARRASMDLTRALAEMRKPN